MKNPERVAELLDALKAECEFRFEFDAVATVAKTVSELPRVTVIDDEHQEFLGKIYHKRPIGGHYYRSYNKLNAALHRTVWAYYNGDIPDGCEIHHVDENKDNNDIANLQCLTKAEHRRLHKAGKIVVVCEVCGRTFLTRDNLPSSICSQKCRDQKRQQQPKPATCEYCGKEFVTNERHSARTCSSECAHALARKTRLEGTAKPHRGVREQRTCVICGNSFTVRKDAATKTCSPQCTAKLRLQTIRNQ